MVRRSGYWLLGLILVFIVALSACGSPQQATPAPTPAQKPSGTTPAPATPTASVQQQLLDAAKKEGEVVIWSNTFQEREKILRLFYDQYPFITIKVWDASGGPDVINKLSQERQAGKVSPDILFLSESDIVPAIPLGLLAEYNWKREGWLNQPNHKFYLNYSLNPRAPTYNTDLVQPSEVPKSWEDLKDPRWRGRAVLSSSGAELPLLMAYLWKDGSKLNWEKSEKYLSDIVANTRPRVLNGFTRPMELLAAGEFAIFPVGAGSRTLYYMTIGGPVAMVPVGKSPGLTRSVAVVKGAPHPNATQVFLDFFSTPEGLLARTEVDFTPVLYPEAAKKAKANLQLQKYGIETVPVPTDVYTEDNLRRATVWWEKLLGIRG